MYLLSRSDDIQDIADQLLPEEEPFSQYSSENSFKKGSDVLEGTIKKFNENIKSLVPGLTKATSKRGSSVMTNVMSGLKKLVPSNPMKRLRETVKTLFPSTEKEPLPPPPPPATNNDVGNGIDGNSGFVMNFFKNPQFDFGKRTNKDTLLILPDENMQSDILPFME